MSATVSCRERRVFPYNSKRYPSRRRSSTVLTLDGTQATSARVPYTLDATGTDGARRKRKKAGNASNFSLFSDIFAVIGCHATAGDD